MPRETIVLNIHKIVIIDINIFDSPLGLSVVVFIRAMGRLLYRITNITQLSQIWDTIRATSGIVNSWVEVHIIDQCLFMRINDDKIYPNKFSHC